MFTYIPEFLIQHPENKKKIFELVKEFDAVNYTDILQGTWDEVERRAKSQAIIKKLQDMGEPDIAAILRP